MLEELYVRNLGVLGEASVAFSPGLNVVTGETGAGKTLLVASLLLLTGSRSDARMVSQGAEEAVVEAVLTLPDEQRRHLVDHGLEDAAEVVVVRKVGADGRSRAWVNGRLAPIGALGEVCGRLVEVLGQGSSFALARPQAQLEALDELAGTGTVLKAYRTALACVRDMTAERDRHAREEQALARERELLEFQASEIETAALMPGEDDLLASEIGRLEHAERLTVTGAEGAALVGSDGAAGRLAEAHKMLEDSARLDPGLETLAARVGALAAEAAEAAWDLRSWAEDLEPDPARLEALRERAALVTGLKRKYGGSIDDVVAFGAEARSRLTELSGADARAVELEQALAALEAEVEGLARDLTRRRSRAAGRLAEAVQAELPALGLPNAVFEVSCDVQDTLGEHGRDRVAFRFSAHPARSPDLLGKVASGGELSRLMIAVTLALAAAHRVPVLVFDEADQGIGGEAALEVAGRLARLGRTHQVLVVSHLPQVAAFADRHLCVRKEDGSVGIEALTDGARLGEISRMLGGLGSSDLARAHAAELVQLARAQRPTARAG